MSFPTASLFGRRRELIASFSSALTIASFLAFSSPFLFLAGPSPETEPADVFSAAASRVAPLGIFLSDSGSLASLFNIGVVVDLSNAIMPLGPRDMLRRCFSDSRDSTVSSVFTDLTGAGRLAEPGLGLVFGADSGFFDLTLAGGGAMTGPPSFRLIVSHCSGNLAEKLEKY